MRQVFSSLLIYVCCRAVTVTMLQILSMSSFLPLRELLGATYRGMTACLQAAVC